MNIFLGDFYNDFNPIFFLGNHGTTLMTCGIMAFQYWILNLSSKLQGANPFEMGMFIFNFVC